MVSSAHFTPQEKYTDDANRRLRLAVVAEGVRAAAVAVVHVAEGRVPVVAHVVARGLAVKLAEAVADVAARLVVGGELLGLHIQRSRTHQ